MAGCVRLLPAIETAPPAPQFVRSFKAKVAIGLLQEEGVSRLRIRVKMRVPEI